MKPRREAWLSARRVSISTPVETAGERREDGEGCGVYESDNTVKAGEYFAKFIQQALA
jgi:hypothetical protein